MKKSIVAFAAISILLLGCSNMLTSPTLAGETDPSARALNSSYGGNLSPAIEAEQGLNAKTLGTPPGIYKQIAGRTAAFLGDPALGSRIIFADVLSARLAAGEKLFLLDIRGASAYTAGHIPGAVNIPLGALFQPENLAKLPTDGTPIVVICVTGHTASMAMAGLGTLGYNAHALRFAMLGWNASTDMKFWSAAQTPQSILGLGGPLQQGATP